MRRLACGLALLGGLACSTGTDVDPDVLIGTYQATQFKIERTGQNTVDILAAGGSVSLELAVGLTTAGRLVIPASAGVAATAIDENLAGQYQVISDRTIRYQSLNDDGFLDDYLFTSDPPELRSFIALSGGGQISLILRKQ